jgi:hypothetical protein
MGHNGSEMRSDHAQGAGSLILDRSPDQRDLPWPESQIAMREERGRLGAAILVEFLLMQSLCLRS